MLTVIVAILIFLAIITTVLCGKYRDSVEINRENFLATCPCDSKPRYPAHLYRKVIYHKRFPPEPSTVPEPVPVPAKAGTSCLPDSGTPTTTHPADPYQTDVDYGLDRESKTRGGSKPSKTSGGSKPSKTRGGSKPSRMPTRKQDSTNTSQKDKQPTHVKNPKKPSAQHQPSPKDAKPKIDHDNIAKPIERFQRQRIKGHVTYSSQFVDPVKNQVDLLKEEDWYNWPEIIKQPEPDSCGAIEIEPTRSSAKAGIYPANKNCNINQYLTIVNKHPNVVYDVECQITPHRVFRCENMDYGKKCYFPPYLNAGKYQCTTSQPGTRGGIPFVSKITVGSSDSPDYTYPKILTREKTLEREKVD